MISVEEYLQQVLSMLTPLPVEQVPVSEALGLVTAEDLPAKLAVPPFTNSQMDGFAYRFEDLNAPGVLPVSGDIPAGDGHDYTLTPGTAMRIMTGARLPAGADTVVKVEDTNIRPGDVPLPSEVEIKVLSPQGTNIRVSGEDAQVGDVIMRTGEVLSPAGLSSLVSVGYSHVPVYRRVRVAVVSTGNELRSAGEPLSGAQIPDSNSILLANLLTRADAQVIAIENCDDDPQHCTDLLASLAGEADLIITSGGVSAGAYDVIKQVGLSQDMHFVQVAMQPGKPQGVGRFTNSDGQSVMIVTLPGNPVSVFVSFHIFVRPLLAGITGRDGEACLTPTAATTSVGWTSPAGKRQFVPVSIIEPTTSGNTPVVTPTHRLGARSHFVASLHRATGLVVVPENVTEVTPWSVVELLRV